MDLEDNEFENGENMKDDWYNQSDTDESIPDPNEMEDSLFQKADTLPVPFEKVYHEEGLVYFMSLRAKRDTSMRALGGCNGYSVQVIHTCLYSCKLCNSMEPQKAYRPIDRKTVRWFHAEIEYLCITVVNL